MIFFSPYYIHAKITKNHLILNKKNGIKVTHFHKKYRFSPVLFRKDNNKITRKKEIKSKTGK